MIIRPSARFRADFPDDTVWNEDGDEIVQSGGQALARAFADILIGAGCTVSEPEDDLEHCGWEVFADLKNYTYWILLTHIDDCHFISRQMHVPLLFGRKRYLEAYPEFLNLVNAAVGADPRFHDFLWGAHPDSKDCSPEPVSP